MQERHIQTEEKETAHPPAQFIHSTTHPKGNGNDVELDLRGSEEILFEKWWGICSALTSKSNGRGEAEPHARPMNICF